MSVIPERTIYTVSRLNREVRLLLDRGLPVIWLEGELSNFSQPSSGHWYFTLKDKEAQIRAAMFRQRNVGTGFTPRSGQHVLARGRVSLYEPRGDYQLIVEHLEEAGVGALRREFERLKAKLSAEGLFDPELKRKLPLIPRRIGVITSPSGAAIRDVLHILNRRFPPADVLIYPTPVQGAAAVPALIAALQLASARAECDVLILARGGGSIEDLWAFNDEGVARAIRACGIPIVTGIGHEIDFTIADFVADARAPTPSAAAELVVPDRQTWLQALVKTAQRLTQAGQRELRAAQLRFLQVERRLRLVHPGIRLQQQAQRLDDFEQRLAQAIQRQLRAAQLRLVQVERRLRPAHPGLKLQQQTRRLADFQLRLGAALRSGLHHQGNRLGSLMTRLMRESPAQRLGTVCARSDALGVRLQHALLARLQRAQHRLELAQRHLDAVSPLAILSRGFAVITRAADGAVLTDAAAVGEGEEIRARLAHGILSARVIRRE